MKRRPEARGSARAGAAPGGRAQGAVLLPVKVVPGAARDQIAGWLGDRLKVRVSAPPEGGRANRAVCALVAARLGLKPGAVTVAAGAGSPEKTLRCEGVSAAGVSAAFGMPGPGT